MIRELLFALALLGPAAAITLFLAWRWVFFRYPQRPRADVSGGRLIWGIVIFFVCQVLIPGILVVSELQWAVGAALLMPLVTIIALWLLWRAHRPKPEHPVRDFLLGVASWAVATPTSALLSVVITLILFALGIQVLAQQAAIDFFLELASNPVLLPIAIVAFVILIPVLEELIFRGYIQSWLRRHLPRQPALLITALCFALMHYAGSQGIGNLVILPSVFAIGYFLGHVYERQGTLFASIGLHITYNALGIFNQLIIS